jgi:hypothetical protein
MKNIKKNDFNKSIAFNKVIQKFDESSGCEKGNWSKLHFFYHQHFHYLMIIIESILVNLQS